MFSAFENKQLKEKKNKRLDHVVTAASLPVKFGGGSASDSLKIHVNFLLNVLCSGECWLEWAGMGSL